MLCSLKSLNQTGYGAGNYGYESTALRYRAYNLPLPRQHPTDTLMGSSITESAAGPNAVARYDTQISARQQYGQ
ncbi:hypothetical protein [Spongiibacter sp. IMCC21906]|uniref:hypothetical protein n=1 Tax=Spongiibacter sp. IMCC21906 TaxID=1620392 RepID=UPI0018CDB3E4|nr:hypothetical protein [Spongiibacter sp. IMCC21906]